MRHEKSEQCISQDLTLVLGGTGKTGRRVAERLISQGAQVRVASRSNVPAFDWHNQETWPKVLEGVTKAFISYAPDLAIPGATSAIREFTRQATQAGVKRLVLLSGRGEEEAQRCEGIVATAGTEWTVVRASWFNQNFSEGEFLSMVMNGAIALPAADVPEPFVDVDDIADVAVAALTERGHNGQTYEVTGPRLLTFADAAAEISRAAGREVEFVQISQQAFASGVAAADLPTDVAWLLNYLFETVLDGRNAYVGDGVQRALGRPPKDFAEYARQIAATGLWRVAA